MQFKSNQHLSSLEKVAELGFLSETDPNKFKTLSTSRGNAFSDPDKSKLPDSQLWTSIS